MPSRSSTDNSDATRGRASSAGGMLDALWRGRLWIAVPVLLAVGAAALWLAAVTPLYRSSAQVLVENQWQTYAVSERGADQRDLAVSEAINGQMQLILSRDLARQVIQRLDLPAHAEFAPDGRSGGWSIAGLLSSIGAFRDPARLTADEQVLARFQERLSVTPADGGRVISIDFVSQDPMLAADIANTVADSYVEMQRGAVAGPGEAPWLAGEIDALRGRVEEAERRVEAYRRDHNLVSGTGGTGGAPLSLVGQELSELTSQLALVRREKSAAQARARLIGEMLEAGAPLEASDILGSPRIEHLAEQEARARAQLAELSSTLGPMHPRIRGLNAELADLRRQSREEAERIVRALETDAEMAAESEAELRRAIDELRHQAGEAGGQELQLRMLEQEAASHRELLQSMLTRTGDVARNSVQQVSPRIIARATPAGAPFYPQTFLVFLSAILAAAILGAAIALIRNGRQGEDWKSLGVPETVSPPAASLAARLDVGARTQTSTGRAKPQGAQSAAANAGLEAIARAIAAPTSGAGRVVLATSPRRMPEVAEVAFALARLAAESGRRVVLVDTRFNETIPALRGVAATGSLAELIGGRCAFDAALMRDPASRVHVIAAGSTRASPLALVSSDRMETVIGALSQTYDAVVLVAPPLSRHGELRVMGQWAQLAVMAARTGESGVNSATSRQRLAEIGIDDVAVVTIEDAPANAPARVARAA